jgi:hypothetical protein
MPRPRPVASLLTALALTGWGGLVNAHEFWIEPLAYQVAPGAELVANLRNGERFSGTPLAFFDSRIARSEMRTGDKVSPFQGRMGDLPALVATAPAAPDLAVLVHQTAPQKLTYRDWETFAAFAEHKDFDDIRARHLARGLPETGFAERYTRFTKALVAVGDGTGADAPTGLETEFVALANPYTDPLPEGLPVLLLYQGAPRADAQVEVFAQAPDGTVEITLTRTDAEGRATIPLAAGHTYLIDAVVLRPAPDGDAVWETLWAALTFARP